MERTESIVVQVAPQFENDKIGEMELFGWNLQNRQEIHEKGEAYGRPSYLDSSTYIVKTTVHQYVKLHFVRGQELPNLDRLRALEAEYFSLPFPQSPSLTGPGCALAGCGMFLLSSIITTVGAFFVPEQRGQAVVSVVMVVVIAGGAYGMFSWLQTRRRQRAAVAEQIQRSLARAEEIRKAARSLWAART